MLRKSYSDPALQMDTANTQAASANIRLRWNYRPDSDLYVICTADQQFASLTAGNPVRFTQHRFAVKCTYLPGGLDSLDGLSCSQMGLWRCVRLP